MDERIEQDTGAIRNMLADLVNEQPTLRDYFAAHALAGLLHFGATDGEVAARAAYAVADGMLKVRNNTQDEV